MPPRQSGRFARPRWVTWNVGESGSPVNGETRQQSDVSEMIWSVSDIMAELSSFFELRAGDLIYTGTPAGVGPLKPGDRIECGIDGLEPLSNTIVATAAR